MKTLMGIFAVCLLSASAMAADPAIELKGMGLNCAEVTQWYYIGNNIQSRQVLPDLRGYVYHTPKVTLAGNHIVLHVSAGFYYCSYLQGGGTGWIRQNPLTWMHFGASKDEMFREATIDIGEYVGVGRDGDLSAEARVPMSKIISTTDLADFEAGKTVDTSLFIANLNGEWNIPGGVFILHFSVNKKSGVSDADMSFFGWDKN